MAVFTPPAPPKGPGRDLPRETNADVAAGVGEEIKLRPESRVSPSSQALYPFNKVTKYLDGSMLEFNTTPGNEYINLQTGDLKARFTMFRNGQIEIRQLGPVFLHEIQNTVKIPESSKGGVKPVHETNVYDGVIQTSSKHRQHVVDNNYFVESKVYLNKSSEAIILASGSITIDGKNTIVLQGPVTINGKVNIQGDVDITGTLRVNGEVVGPEGPASTPQSDFNLGKTLLEKSEEARKEQERKEEILNSVVDELSIGGG